MPFDFKKEYREFYQPKCVPAIVDIPRMSYVAVRGSGDPNEQGGAYQKAISMLYGISYTIRMSYKGDYRIEGFFEYVVPPLEGLWQQKGVSGVDLFDKSGFDWVSLIRLPDFVSEADFEWAARETGRKKGIDCSAAEFLTIDEGLCVQIMHIGSYDSEPRSVALMD
nr:GyrI-like domain-containing protein [Oscillospiraceae bacterium]